MLSCKEVARLTSESMDRTLTLGEKVSLSFHKLICGACKCYCGQIHAFRDAIKEWSKNPCVDSETDGQCLDEEGRAKIKAAIKASQNQ
ncbi:MAG: hypothetical protein JKX97_02320 [Candidatus Lindowbacteria bacterium]|nr:hypothetical protein [Candidatus Lindowbacteria bacterium]